MLIQFLSLHQGCSFNTLHVHIIDKQGTQRTGKPEVLHDEGLIPFMSHFHTNSLKMCLQGKGCFVLLSLSLISICLKVVISSETILT